jgi:cytochrome d ubiquinol oxidase subunit I
MDFDVALLSRLQFAFTLLFHILFPTQTIGLAAFLVVLEAAWLKTGRDAYYRLFRFWMKIFGLCFGVGVVSGVVLSYEFGTNFSKFSYSVGPIVGPLIAYEVMTAFFLEAGFLGIMLFGLGRVPRGVHFFATLMVSIGTMISSFWILSANSFMHTPAGFTVEGVCPDCRLLVASWMDAIFNPSFPYRLAHMLTASFVTGSFIVAGVSAWFLLQGRAPGFAKRGLSLALWMALIVAPAQILIGDAHGLNTEEHQPLKVAAMEGRWDTMKGAPLILFAVPSQKDATNYFEIAIPYGASLILKHSLEGEIKGLKEAPPENRPPVAIVFFAFRIMVALGFLFVGVAVLGLLLRLTGRLLETRWYLRLLTLVAPLGLIATMAGWIVTEVGRQPWVVHGILRTHETVSPIAASSVGKTLAVFLVAYAFIFVSFLIFLFRMIKAGPDMVAPVPTFKPRHSGPKQHPAE